jgi:hypothetical protein
MEGLAASIFIFRLEIFNLKMKIEASKSLKPDEFSPHHHTLLLFLKKLEIL